MTIQEITFLIDNRINFESVKLGYTRNVSFDVLEGYELLYRKYLDERFVLTYWCPSCVFDMMNRLIAYCEDNEDFMRAWNGETINESKKRGRAKK